MAKPSNKTTQNSNSPYRPTGIVTPTTDELQHTYDQPSATPESTGKSSIRPASSRQPYDRPGTDNTADTDFSSQQALGAAEAAGDTAGSPDNASKDLSDQRGDTKNDKNAGAQQKNTGSGEDNSSSDPESNFTYSGGKQKKRKGFWNRKRAAIAGGVLGIGMGGGMFLFWNTLPFKVMGVFTNIEDTFFSSFNDASDKMTQNLFRHYIVRKVMPGMITGGCQTTKINKSCAMVAQADNPIEALYTTWRDAKLESKLANDHGIEIRRDGNNFSMHFSSKGLKENIDLGAFTGNSVEYENKVFQQMDRSEIRHYTKTALADTNLYRQTRQRYTVGKLLERKYGIRRCVVACKVLDKVDDTVDAKKSAAKSYIAERVIAPYNESLGLAMLCVIDAARCADLNDSNDRGERLSKYEVDINQRFLRYRAQSGLGDKSLDDLLKVSKEIEEKGMVRFIAEKVVGQTAGKFVGKALPIIGWVDFGAKLVQGAQTIGPMLKHINYAMNSAAMVQLFSLYRTHGDELKHGFGMDMEIAGSLATSLDADENNDQGGGGMTQSPAYQMYFGDKGNPVQARFASVFSDGKVHAAEPNAVAKCDDGPYPDDSLVCPEVAFGATSTIGKITDAISAAANSPFGALPGFVAGLWNNTLGKVMDWIGSGLGAALDALTPDQLKQAGEQIITWLSDTVFKKFLVVPFTENMSGARIIELAMGGANVAGNDAAHFAAGGKALTAQQATIIRERQLAERNATFNDKPLYDRVFDGTDSQSLISRIAMAAPSSRNALLGGIFTTRNKITLPDFGTKKVSAAIPAVDPWGVTQYGYPDNDPVFTEDPVKYWDDHDCKNPDNAKIWGDKAQAINPDTGQPVQNETNGCLLIETAVSANGSRYNKDLIDRRFDTTQVANNEDDGGANEPADPNAPGGTVVGGFALPVDKKYYDEHPQWFSKPHHDYPAADIPVATGTPIYSLIDGTVTAAPVGGGCGLGVLIENSEGISVKYCHGIDGGRVPGARRGATVKKGQLVMHAGNTGRSFGPHLHMELEYKGSPRCPQNLLVALGKGSATLPSVSSLPTGGCSY